MGYTAFAAQLPAQKQAWVKESIRVFRENFFFQKFTGTGPNNIVQLITELKKTEKGDRAYIGLVHDLGGSGIVGDNDIDGRFDDLESEWIEIHTDQLRKGVKSKGKVDDQRSVFDFRTEARDKLAYWRAQILEELMILSASGVSFAYNTDGSTRATTGQDALTLLEYAADVAAPTSGRHFNFTSDALAAGDTTTISSSSVPQYGMIVDLMAEAKTRGVKPLRIGGKDHYVYLCHPKTYARLKRDDDFRTAVITAGVRSDQNPIFSGATVTMDGLIIHTNNRVFNTRGLASGSKWGSGGAIDGTRSLLMGCQALGFADIWKMAQWSEETTDHGAKNEIVIGMYNGIIKPQFTSSFDSDTTQDFGVIAVNLAL